LLLECLLWLERRLLLRLLGSECLLLRLQGLQLLRLGYLLLLRLEGLLLLRPEGLRLLRLEGLLLLWLEGLWLLWLEGLLLWLECLLEGTELLLLRLLLLGPKGLEKLERIESSQTQRL